VSTHPTTHPTREYSPSHQPISTSFDPNRNRNTSPQSWNIFQSIAPLRIRLLLVLSDLIFAPHTHILAKSNISLTHSILINSVSRQREWILYWKGMLLNHLTCCLSHQMVEIERIFDSVYSSVLTWVLIAKIWCSSSSFDPIRESETDPESWNRIQSNAPFRIHDKSLFAKVMFVRQVLKSVTPIFHGTWSLFDFSMGEASWYTIRVGSVQHTSHSKEPSIFCLRFYLSAFWQLGDFGVQWVDKYLYWVWHQPVAR
jgi:hypothetical protein